ncbi:MAG: SIS domain-containing protein, partial [Planctomycetota bacterium]
MLLQLQDAAAELESANELLRGVPGVTCLLRDQKLTATLDQDLAAMGERIGELERNVDDGSLDLSPDQLETFNAGVVRLRDAVWAVRKDRLRTAATVADLSGADPSGTATLTDSAIASYASITNALSALDRLEVRGRDSAGIHVLVEGHGLDLDAADINALLQPRLADRLFTSGAVRTPEGHLCFVYKAAAEIGELGDNSRVLRDAIRKDELLKQALAADTAAATVLCHTRWASVGIISQPNAHPVNQEEQE